MDEWNLDDEHLRSYSSPGCFVLEIHAAYLCGLNFFDIFLIFLENLISELYRNCKIPFFQNLESNGIEAKNKFALRF